MTDTSSRKWSLMFLAAAVFNFAMGGPIFFASSWSYQLAYEASPTESTLRFWGDFGFSVLLIGVGYLMVSRDLIRNRGIVWLGIFAKLFDVVALSWRASHGVARPIVLFPAAIDGIFVILFVLFLRSTTSKVVR
jgi:hypothetical protein